MMRTQDSGYLRSKAQAQSRVRAYFFFWAPLTPSLCWRPAIHHAAHRHRVCTGILPCTGYFDHSRNTYTFTHVGPRHPALSVIT